MKQLSALGARRHFFRGPRRMRALRAGMSPSELEESELMGPGFGYYNGESPNFVTIPLQKQNRIVLVDIIAPKPYMSRLVGKPTIRFPTRSDTNRHVQSQKRDRSLKFRI